MFPCCLKHVNPDGFSFQQAAREGAKAAADKGAGAAEAARDFVHQEL